MSENPNSDSNGARQTASFNSKSRLKSQESEQAESESESGVAQEPLTMAAAVMGQAAESPQSNSRVSNLDDSDADDGNRQEDEESEVQVQAQSNVYKQELNASVTQDSNVAETAAEPLIHSNLKPHVSSMEASVAEAASDPVPSPESLLPGPESEPTGPTEPPGSVAATTETAPGQLVKKTRSIPKLTPLEEENLITSTLNSFQPKRYGLRDGDVDSLKLIHSVGLHSHKRSNVHYVSSTTIVTTVGNLVVFFDLLTLTPTYFKGVREGSIGAIAVHPELTHLALGEISQTCPNIYIYTYPTMKLVKILPGGAVKGYADLAFTHTGSKLASVATEPDYMLTLWDWQDRVILLRSKAFSQDVYKIAFSPGNDGVLTTSGMGHIKFWRMANTFTGLKLQGYLGKFGASELTDISCFVQLGDGKVVSGSEEGKLLLWDGGMIKCEIGRKGKKPCHQGRIEVVLLGDGEVITAGEDGFVRFWNLETIDNADVVSTAASSESTSASTPRVFEIEPTDETLISKEVKIKSLVRDPFDPFQFVALDQNGQLVKFSVKKKTTVRIHAFHSGPVYGVSFSPYAHVAATVGADGSLRIYNYLMNELVVRKNFSQGGTFVAYLPLGMDSTGSTVLVGFADGVIRFISIVAQKTPVVAYLLKPFKSPVISATFSHDCTRLAVGATDGSIFLFHLQVKKNARAQALPFSKTAVQITPLGFFSTTNPVESLAFLHEEERWPERTRKNAFGKTLVVSGADGSLWTACIPNEPDFDTTTTYSINSSLLFFKKWSLNVPEALVAPTMTSTNIQDINEGDDGLNANGRLSQAKSTSLSQSMLSTSLNSIRKQKGLNITSASRIFAACAIAGGYFAAAVENQDFEYEIRLLRASKPEFSYLIGVVTDQVSFMKLDNSKRYLMVGTKHGKCCLFLFNPHELPFDFRDADLCPSNHDTYADYVSNFEERIASTLKTLQNDLKTLDINNPPPHIQIQGQQWNTSLHDIVHGRITGFQASFDGSHFMSTGADGGIFVWNFTPIGVQEVMPITADLSEQLNRFGQTEADEVDAPEIYSLEEEKIKREKDKEVELAQGKKERMRAEIDMLRVEFQKIVEEVEKAPPGMQLKREDLVVDPYLRGDIQKESETKREILIKELAWAAEKDAIGARKLQEKFLVPVQDEMIELEAFKTNATVSTFRTLKSTNPGFSSAAVSQGTDQMTSNGESENVSGEVNRHLNLTGSLMDGPSHGTKHLHNINKVQNAAAKKMEARKQFRLERAVKWKRLMDSKPDGKYQDPQDVAAIRYATAHLGDYKLKSAENYIVPESERVDADKKNRQMQLLKSSIKEFNAKVFRMRSKKVDIVGQFERARTKLKEIDQKLVKFNAAIINEDDYVPELELGIFPENRTIVTSEDIALLQQQEALEAASAGRKGDDIGFGAQQHGEVKAKKKTKYPSRAIRSFSTQNIGDKETAYQNQKRPELVKLEYQKQTIIQTLDSQVEEFDSDISKLSKEKILLMVDLKFADIKLQVLFREWMLLKEFEQTDNILAEKLNTKMLEKTDIETKVDEYREKLQAKKEEIEGIIHKEKELHDEFKKSIGENNKNEEYLIKVFKRKIKRVKKKIAVENEDEEEEEESDDDTSSYNSDEEENREFEERIPHDLDPQIWTRVFEMRERRLDLEEYLTEIQKSVELLKKENDLLIKKEKGIDMALKAAEGEIEDFQTLKQRKLNELDVVVPLRFHQIQHLVENTFPNDTTTSLVFYNQGLHQLKRRIKELNQEKSDIKKQHRELKKHHVMFNKSKKEKEQRVAELSAKSREVQMLKFGQVVDLEKLEKLGAIKAADEVKEKLLKQDNQRLREIAEMEVAIRQEKDNLMNFVKTNTEYLEKIVELRKQRDSLERALNLSQTVLTNELSGPSLKDTQEKEKFITLVQHQAVQIEMIKAEIEALIRKPTSKTFVKTPIKSSFPALPTNVPVALGAAVSQGLIEENGAIPLGLESAQIQGEHPSTAGSAAE